MEDIRPLLAEADVDEPEDDFVELTVERLLNLLDLPMTFQPLHREGLPASEGPHGRAPARRSGPNAAYCN